MKKLKFNLKNVAMFAACFAVSIMLFSGCKKDPGEPKSPTGNMQTIVLKGIVHDAQNGSPLSGVRVITGSASATTNSDGTFSFSEAQVVDKRAVIKFEKGGYFTLTRSGVKAGEMFIKAVLQPKGNSDITLETTFETSEAKTLEVTAGMKVKLQAQSIMRADGTPYSGTVKADMLYLDPNNENFSGMMPGGDLAALREDNKEVMLISWGMTNVNLTDNAGKPLQLKGDVPAEITYPIPAGMESNPPPTIPLWHFDETKGIWIEDGVATLKGNVYVGNVTHFSWSNLDVPAERVTITGKVVDCQGNPVTNTNIKVEQTGTYTNSKGEFSIFVPEWTPVTISVTAFGKNISINVPGQPGGTVYNVGNIKTSCPVTIKGKVVCIADNQPATFVKVTAGSVETTTNSKGEYTIVISDNTPVTVKATTKGGSDSEFVPGQPENTVYTVRDLRVPCDQGEPGTQTKTEKGSVKYRCEGERIMVFTFDEYGWRVRLDTFDENEEPSSQNVMIVNHFDRYFWLGYASSGEWKDNPYDFDENPFSFLAEIFAFNETAYSIYQQPNNITIAGKSCKHYIMNYGYGAAEYASWNGLLMLWQFTQDGETTTLFRAEAATINVPEKAFTKTFNISWLP